MGVRTGNVYFQNGSVSKRLNRHWLIIRRKSLMDVDRSRPPRAPARSKSSVFKQTAYPHGYFDKNFAQDFGDDADLQNKEGFQKDPHPSSHRQSLGSLAAGDCRFLHNQSKQQISANIGSGASNGKLHGAVLTLQFQIQRSIRAPNGFLARLVALGV
jgi:hypothetical protein